ncbi:hypothetical protein ACMA1I_07640 [Pontibacter sp. 13R65]|uniref:hypothetical protein n=1 Tax=Pontibacter sp. 13R65 TaxID=3127458 RepID=UPI00301DD385
MAKPLRAQYAENYHSGLHINIEDREDYYIQFILWDQKGENVSENNPGALIYEHPQSTSFDVSVLRMLAMAQLSPRFLIMTQIGINSQTLIGGEAAGIGTCLGQKRVFNIGAGLYTQAVSTLSFQNGAYKLHNIALFSGDVFINMPFSFGSRGMAFTAYNAVSHYDFGPNYLIHSGTRNLGAANPEYQGERPISEPGNARPMLGSCSMYYGQTGMLLPRLGDRDKVRLQPSFDYTRKNLNALATGGNYWDFEAYLLVQEHNAKISFQSSLRSNYIGTDRVDGQMGEFIV